MFKASINKLDLWKETQTKGNFSKGNIKVLLSKNAMHLYGIRWITVCVTEIKISDKSKLEQKKLSIAILL